jgi:hypothetical protein
VLMVVRGQKGSLADGRTIVMLGLLQRKLRACWRAYDESHVQSLSGLLKRVVSDDNFGLDVVDCLLSHLVSEDWRVPVHQLDAYLLESGSAWRVAPTGEGLERRVDETTAIRAQQGFQERGRAGEHLKRSWSAAYRRSPNPVSRGRKGRRGSGQSRDLPR